MDQVFPSAVMATPAKLTTTETTFTTFMESCPKNAPMKRVKSPEVEFNTIVLETLVRARAAFVKYCQQQKSTVNKLILVNIRQVF